MTAAENCIISAQSTDKQRVIEKHNDNKKIKAISQTTNKSDKQNSSLWWIRAEGSIYKYAFQVFI